MPTGRGRSRSGADKGYDAEDFVEELRDVNVRPHVAQNSQWPALGDRRAHHPPPRLCAQPAHPQADRGGVRLDQDGGRPAEDQLRGLARVDWAFTFAAAAYNLVRLPKLLAEATT